MQAFATSDQRDKEKKERVAKKWSKNLPRNKP
jgi:hypothetical protein